MKIALEYADMHVTLEMEGNDYTGDEVVEAFTRMMVVAGYPPSVVRFADDDGGGYQYVAENEEVVKRERPDAD